MLKFRRNLLFILVRVVVLPEALAIKNLFLLKLLFFCVKFQRNFIFFMSF